jgi:ADP-ribosylglycohydrolase
MLGAIIGDIVGSRFEFNNTNKTDFELFTPECSYTDDTICTVAIADAILNGKSYKDSLLEWCRKYPNPKGSYGGSFARWIHERDPQPYNSYGNGSAMRVSPIAWAYDTYEAVTLESYRSAIVSHNHPEGVKGAQVVAELIYGLRTGNIVLPESTDNINAITTKSRHEYPIPTMKEIRSSQRFDETCQVTVPQAIRCFLEAKSFEETIRLAVSIGGDSDTIAAIAGSIAESCYQIPENIKNQALEFIPGDMRIIVDQFYNTIQNG